MDKTEFAEGEVLVFIENIVNETGYPILASILQQNGVATRSELRKLERSGKLTAVPMVYGGQYVMAYHINGQVPKYNDTEGDGENVNGYE